MVFDPVIFGGMLWGGLELWPLVLGLGRVLRCAHLVVGPQLTFPPEFALTVLTADGEFASVSFLVQHSVGGLFEHLATEPTEEPRELAAILLLFLIVSLLVELAHVRCSEHHPAELAVDSVRIVELERGLGPEGLQVVVRVHEA